MADKDREAVKAETSAFERTPGTPEDAKAIKDRPLSIGEMIGAAGGPRDALVIDGHNDQDYVPDVDTKGYHTGMVRQPVMAMVDGSGRIVGFEAVDESMFSRAPTIQDLKAAHNRAESKGSLGEGRNLGDETPPTAVGATAPTVNAEAAKAENAGAAGAGPKAKSSGSKA